MSATASSDEGRREALRSLARWLAAGALALTGGWLLARRRAAGRCPGACRRCPARRQCTLPDAEAARRAKPRE